MAGPGTVHRSRRWAPSRWFAAVVAAVLAVPLVPAAPAAAASSGGSVYVWGVNFTGQLGNGPLWAAVPVPLPDVDGIVFTDLDIGVGFDLALSGGGTVYGWGQNSFGQLGRGVTSAVERTPAPAEIPDEVMVTAIAAGYQHGMALAGNGTAYTWGQNTSGQLGDGTTDNRGAPRPVVMPEGISFAALAGGQDASLAVAGDGTVHTWGANHLGQLGDGTTDAREPIPAPVTMPDRVRFTAVSAGVQFAMALSEDGTVYTWGSNTVGQLGNGDTGGFEPTPAPVVMPEGVRFTAVSAGRRFAMALADDGTVYAWGDNTVGQLGNGTSGPGPSTNLPGPIAMPSGTSFAAVDGGHVMGSALTAGGALYVWGRNVNWRFGDGTSNSSNTPVQTQPPDGGTFGAMAISSGGAASGGLTGLPPHAVAAHDGDGQAVHVHQPFPDPLQAAVTTQAGDPVRGVPVTFAIHSLATFDGGGSSAVVLTADGGLAASPPLVATGEPGTVQVTATVPGVSPAATFTLTVAEAPPPEPPADLPVAPPAGPTATAVPAAPGTAGTADAAGPGALPDTGGRTGWLLRLASILATTGILLALATRPGVSARAR